LITLVVSVVRSVASILKSLNVVLTALEIVKASLSPPQSITELSLTPSKIIFPFPLTAIAAVSSIVPCSLIVPYPAPMAVIAAVISASV